MRVTLGDTSPGHWKVREAVERGPESPESGTWLSRVLAPRAICQAQAGRCSSSRLVLPGH